MTRGRVLCHIRVNVCFALVSRTWRIAFFEITKVIHVLLGRFHRRIFLHIHVTSPVGCIGCLNTLVILTARRHVVQFKRQAAQPRLHTNVENAFPPTSTPTNAYGNVNGSVYLVMTGLQDAGQEEVCRFVAKSERACRQYWLDRLLVHNGQHVD